MLGHFKAEANRIIKEAHRLWTRALARPRLTRHSQDTNEVAEFSIRRRIEPAWPTCREYVGGWCPKESKLPDMKSLKLKCERNCQRF